MVITEWLPFSNNKVLRIKLLAALELHDYVGKLLGAIELYATQNGGTRVQLVGRKAWTKLLKEYDYQQEAVVLFKDLVKGES